LAATAKSDRELKRLVDDKWSWIAHQPSSAAGRKERFETLRSLTQELRAYVGDGRHGARNDFERCRQGLAANAILQRRDYAFCLYPEDLLREYLTSFLGAAD
jgi:hypothetical protein